MQGVDIDCTRQLAQRAWLKPAVRTQGHSQVFIVSNCLAAGLLQTLGSSMVQTGITAAGVHALSRSSKG